MKSLCYCLLSLLPLFSGRALVTAKSSLQLDLDVINLRHSLSQTYEHRSFLNKVVDDVGTLVGRDYVDDSLNLTTSYNFYLTNITVGTPGQDLQVGLDTGSPYMWVFGPQAKYGNATQFYPNDSSTFEWLDINFTAGYGAGGVFGEWGEDDVSLGGYTMNEFQFAVVDDFSLSAGVPGLLGIGPGAQLDNVSYSNLQEALFESGLTNSPAFSIYLDRTSTGGGVIFGGIDTGRFIPPLYRYDLPTVEMGSISNFYYEVFLDSATISGQTETISSYAVLDTGSPFSQLPPYIVDKVGEAAGMTPYDKYRTFYIPKGQVCNNTNTVVTLNIGYLSIDISISDLLVPGEYLWMDDGPQGVQALAMIGSNSVILGDAFFRNAYTVMDSLNRKVYLAKTPPQVIASLVLDIYNGTLPGSVPGFNDSEETGPYSGITYSTLTSLASLTIDPTSMFYHEAVSTLLDTSSVSTLVTTPIPTSII